MWDAHPRPSPQREETNVSFREKARRKLQERAQAAQRGGGQDEPAEAPDAGHDPEADHPEDQPAASAPAQTGYAAELEQLAKLKDQGILTEEEFAAKKAQILGI
jgi:hypothetical protein